MSGSKRGYVGIYGATAIPKQFCEECQRVAFILDGEYACCRNKAQEDPERKRFRREIHADHKRRPRISQPQQQAQLELQDNRCYYCYIPFGSSTIRKGKAIKLRLEWDHFAPFGYSGNSDAKNLVAACQVCNKIKFDYVFHSSEEAIAYVQKRRTEKGYL